jgi:Rrf2 family protein
MLALSEQTEGAWASTAAIARAMGVPQPFLHKITADMVRAGLVQTRPGPTGGLALARPASQINLRQILETIDGPICLNVCLRRPHECPRDTICPAHGFWGRLQATIVRELQHATLDTLAVEAQRLKSRPRRESQSILLDLVQAG